MKHIILHSAVPCIVAILSLCGCVTPEKKQTSYTQDEMNRMFWYQGYVSKATGMSIMSRCYVPHEEPGESFPLVLFLHGAGQSGTNNVDQLYEGDVGKLSYYASTENRFYVLVPQCPPDMEWTDPVMLDTLNEFVTNVATRLSTIDPQKVIVSGFSMGGIGAFELARRHPETFSAVVPICGGWKSWTTWERPDVPAAFGKDIGIWSINNVNDQVVDNFYSKQFISQVVELGNKNVHYTEGFQGHADEYVFDDKNLIIWMLSQKNPAKKR